MISNPNARLDRLSEIAMSRQPTLTELDLDEDTLHGLAGGGGYEAEPRHRALRSGKVHVNKAVIAIIAGSLFLVAALAALMISLICVYSGVFDNGTEPGKAVAGFFGGLLIAAIASYSGYRFISRA